MRWEGLSALISVQCLGLPFSFSFQSSFGWFFLKKCLDTYPIIVANPSLLGLSLGVTPIVRTLASVTPNYLTRMILAIKESGHEFGLLFLGVVESH
jgi:hypothetical protein